MRYYKVDRQEGKYRVRIYKILFSLLVPVFDAYTGSVQEVNTMLNRYRQQTGVQLNTLYSLQAGRG